MNRKPAIFEREKARIERHLAGGAKPIRSITHVREIKTQAELMRGTGRLQPEPYLIDLEPAFAQFRHTDLNPIDRYYLNLSSPIQTTPVSRLLGRGKTVPITWRPERKTSEEPLKFIHILASKQDQVNISNATQFLVSTADKVSFEVIGNQREVVFQLACHESYFQRLVGILQTHYEVSEFVETENDALDMINGREIYVAEYALDTSHFIPLASLDSFSVEPMQVLMGILDEVDPGQSAGLQVVFQPCRNNWAWNLQRAAFTELEKQPISDDPDITPLVKQKLVIPFFAVAIRTLATSNEILSRFVSYALQFQEAHNRLIPLQNAWQEDRIDLIVDGLYARMAWRPGMILNARELVSFVHLPPESVFSDKLKRVRIQKIRAPLPLIEAEDGVLVGENLYHNHPYHVRIPANVLNRHMLVAGSTRMGKSTLMGNMLRSLIRQGKGIFVVDPKGSLAKAIAASIPQEMVDKTIYFNPADRDYPIAMNLMRFAKHYDHQELINDLVSILDKITVTLMPATPRMWELFSGAMRFFLRKAQTDETITLRNVRDFFHNTAYRERMIAEMDDELERYYWQAYQTTWKQSRQPDVSAMGLTARLAQLVDDPTIANIICAKECKLDFTEIFNEERLFIADLGDVGELRKNFLGRLLVAEGQLSCMHRPASTRTDVFFFMDEFQDYQTSAFEDVLARGAEYRMNMVLAHQNYAQVEHKTMQSVLGNVGTIVSFRVGEDYAARLARSYANTWHADAFLSLPEYECLVRVGNKQFSMRSFSDDEYAEIEGLLEVPESLTSVVEHTRQRYAYNPTEPPQEETTEGQETPEEPDYQPWSSEEEHFPSAEKAEFTPKKPESKAEQESPPSEVEEPLTRKRKQKTDRQPPSLPKQKKPKKDDESRESPSVEPSPQPEPSEESPKPEFWTCPVCGRAIRNRPSAIGAHKKSHERKGESPPADAPGEPSETGQTVSPSQFDSDSPENTSDNPPNSDETVSSSQFPTPENTDFDASPEDSEWLGFPPSARWHCPVCSEEIDISKANWLASTGKHIRAHQRKDEWTRSHEIEWQGFKEQELISRRIAGRRNAVE